MSLIRRRPVSFSHELDAFFDKFLDANNKDASHMNTSNWHPSVGLKEENERYVVFADIPGVKPEDIHVSVENNLLTISGEREHEATKEADGHTRIEREHDSFNRQFRLPDIASSSSDIMAKFNHGVLEVSIPKQIQEKPQRIRVSVNNDQ